MARKEIPYIEVLRKLARSGLKGSPEPNRVTGSLSSLPSLEERVRFLLGIINQSLRPPSNMLFFVMYDIESNKVRYHIAKYLERKGCVRIQKSIFLADQPRETYEEIKTDLAEVQSLYENNDSIVVCPVSTDQLRAMKVIGQKLEVDIFTHPRNTLFF